LEEFLFTPYNDLVKLFKQIYGKIQTSTKRYKLTARDYGKKLARSSQSSW